MKNTERSEHQRDNILDVARNMFAAKGFEATTTREINKELGIADGLLYYYFPHGKQEILDTIVHQGIAERINDIHIDFADVQTSAELEQQLMDFFDRIWALFSSDDNYESFIITIRERPLLSDDESSWLSVITEQIQTNIGHALEDVADIVECDEADVMTLAAIIMSIFQRTLYDVLLVKNQREASPQTHDLVQRELHLLLNK